MAWRLLAQDQFDAVGVFARGMAVFLAVSFVLVLGYYVFRRRRRGGPTCRQKMAELEAELTKARLEAEKKKARQQQDKVSGGGSR